MNQKSLPNHGLSKQIIIENSPVVLVVVEVQNIMVVVVVIVEYS